jgi:hypothetical protein
MAEKDQVHHQHMRLGCGLLALVLSLALITPLILAINYQRHLVRYPEARLIPGRTKYIIRPRHLRLENAYLVPAPLNNVRHWYADRFNLRPLGGEDGCASLARTTQYFVVERYMVVRICETPGGQKIFVVRATLLLWRPKVTS